MTTCEQAVLEAARACSNVARLSDDSRQCLLDHGAHGLFLDLLRHDDAEVAFTACGVILNLASFGGGRAALVPVAGPRKLVDALALAWNDRVDAGVCSMVCKALCNALTRGGGGGDDDSGDGVSGWLSADECVTLLSTLGDVIDCVTDPDEDSGFARAEAEELLAVATRLRSVVQGLVHDGVFREDDAGSAWEPL